MKIYFVTSLLNATVLIFISLTVYDPVYAVIGTKIPNAGGAIVNMINSIVKRTRIPIASATLRRRHFRHCFFSTQKAKATAKRKMRIFTKAIFAPIMPVTV